MNIAFSQEMIKLGQEINTPLTQKLTQTAGVKDISFIKKDIPGIRGAFLPSKNKIFLGSKAVNDPMVIAHELGHANTWKNKSLINKITKGSYTAGNILQNIGHAPASRIPPAIGSLNYLIRGGIARYKKPTWKERLFPHLREQRIKATTNDAKEVAQRLKRPTIAVKGLGNLLQVPEEAVASIKGYRTLRAAGLPSSLRLIEPVLPNAISAGVAGLRFAKPTIKEDAIFRLVDYIRKKKLKV